MEFDRSRFKRAIDYVVSTIPEYCIPPVRDNYSLVGNRHSSVVGVFFLVFEKFGHVVSCAQPNCVSAGHTYHSSVLRKYSLFVVVRQDVVCRMGRDKQERLPEAMDCLGLQPEASPSMSQHLSV